MAANIAVKEKTETDWARQLRGAQQDYKRRQPTSPNLRLTENKSEQVVPPAQQNFQPIRMPSSMAATNMVAPEESAYEEIPDMTMNSEEDDNDEIDTQSRQRQLAFSRLQAQRAQAEQQQATETDADETAAAGNSALMQTATAALDKAGEGSATVKLFSRLMPGDERNQKITGKIGFVIRVVLLCFGGLEFITPIDKAMSMVAGGGKSATTKDKSSGKEITASQPNTKEGEKKTDTLLTISLFLSMAMQLFIMFLPLFIILFVAGGIAKAVS
jgi:hypothetical protein